MTVAHIEEGAPRRRLRAAGPVFRRTDYGNAERLIHHHGKDLLNLRGQWYVWDGTRYRLDQTGAVERLAKKTVRNIWLEAKGTAEGEDPDTAKKLGQHAADSESRARLAAMVTLAATELPVVVDQADELDADPWVLNCANGTIDLRTGELRPHDRADRITRCTGITADMDAEAPAWEAFLARILPDSGAREFMQRIVGYTLTGLTSEEKLFILNGKGANGKSTLIDAIMMVLGEYGMPAPPDLLLSKRPGGPSNDVAALRGARLASAAETEDGSRLDEVRTKALVTGDVQSARFLHREFFSFRPQAKYWIATNHRPIVRGSDEGIWRRMVLIPFEAFIPPAERDKKLAKKLRAEAPGILAWAVRGCLAWQRDGLSEPPVIQDATAGYRADQDLIGTFLEDACVLHPKAHAPATALYHAYRTWCETSGENPQTQRRFGDRLRERPGLHRVKSGTISWYGLGLRAGGSWDHLEVQDQAESPTAAPERPAERPAATAEGDGTTASEAASSATSCSTDAPSAGEPCAVCASLTTMWCGYGGVSEERLPCLVCGEPTATRAACGAVRHANCRRDDNPPAGPDTPSDPTPAAPAPRALRPVVTKTEERIDPAEELRNFSKVVTKKYPGANAEDLRAGLARWREVTDQLCFVSYPGEVGVAAYARLVARHGAMPLPARVEGEHAELVKSISGNLTLFRDYLVSGQTLPEQCWITGVDVNFQFTAAARSVELGDGEPILIEAPRSPVPLLARPGYFEIARATATGHPAFGRLSKGSWITTQTAKYLIKNRDVDLPVSRALLWPKHGRRLNVWAGTFGEAYKALKPCDDLPSRYALWAVKAVATTTLGGMLRSETYNRTAMLRPDWSDQVITLAGANMHRALDKAAVQGNCHLGVWRDAAWFVSSDPAPLTPSGLEFSGQPGKWKVERHAELTPQMREAYETGQPSKEFPRGKAATFRDTLIAAVREEGGRG